MATISLKPWGIITRVPEAELLQAAEYVIPADAVAYDTTSANLFVLPDNCLLVGLGAKVTAAYTGAGAGDYIKISDGTNTILELRGTSLLTANLPIYQPVYQNYTSGVTIAFASNLAASAGSITFYAHVRFFSSRRDLWNRP